MPDVVERSPITASVIATVEAATSHPVGDDDAPDDTSGPYTIVRPLPGGMFDGSLAGPHEMAVFAFQVESYNRARAGCEWLADRNRAALLASFVQPDGWRVMHVDQPGVGGVDNEGRDEENELPLFACRDDFTVQVTRAP